MIEIKEKFYSLKIYANSIKWTDLFKVIRYSDFKGDIENVPAWFHKEVRHTADIDLSQDLETILSGMKSNTRNEVRRAEREGVVIDETCSVDDFVDYYNKFAEEKGLNKISNKSVTKYPDVKIVAAKHNDSILSMHASFIDYSSKSASLLFSCSLKLGEDIDKKMVGWANRYLHYKEFEIFKAMGLTTYEWCGVCIDPEDKAKYSIGQFKLGFGGNDIRECYHLSSPLFMLANKLSHR